MLARPVRGVQPHAGGGQGLGRRSRHRVRSPRSAAGRHDGRTGGNGPGVLSCPFHGRRGAACRWARHAALSQSPWRRLAGKGRPGTLGAAGPGGGGGWIGSAMVGSGWFGHKLPRSVSNRVRPVEQASAALRTIRSGPHPHEVPVLSAFPPSGAAFRTGLPRPSAPLPERPRSVRSCNTIIYSVSSRIPFRTMPAFCAPPSAAARTGGP